MCFDCFLACTCRLVSRRMKGCPKPVGIMRHLMKVLLTVFPNSPWFSDKLPRTEPVLWIISKPPKTTKIEQIVKFLTVMGIRASSNTKQFFFSNPRWSLRVKMKWEALYWRLSLAVSLKQLWRGYFLFKKCVLPVHWESSMYHLQFYWVYELSIFLLLCYLLVYLLHEITSSL